MLDVIRSPFRVPIAEQERADLEAVQRGELRLVRCYVEPDSGEHRRQWKPGRLQVSVHELKWKGSSRRWQPIFMPAGEWAIYLRHPTRDDHVYKSFGIIECVRGSERHALAVPRNDVDLCVALLC
jgi:hypothetical protein